MLKIPFTLKTVQNCCYYSYCKTKHLSMLFVSVCLFTGAVLTVEVACRRIVNQKLALCFRVTGFKFQA